MATSRSYRTFTVAAVCFVALVTESLWMKAGLVKELSITNNTPQHDHIIEENKNTTSLSYSEVAIITAFNHKGDVFKGKGPVNASFDYIEKWYRSVQQHPTIKGIVLHNMFSQQSTTDWSNNGQFLFISVPNTTRSFQKGKVRPINDMRFFVLEAALNGIQQQQATALPYVLFSDSHDVALLRNPFELMVEMDNLLGERQVYIGEESLFSQRKGEYDHYMNKSSVQCFGKELPHTSRMINCGLIGGHYDVVLSLVKKLRQKLEKAPPKKVCDQISLWYVLKQEYGDKFISGYPFNSRFMKYETSEDTLAYIAHK